MTATPRAPRSGRPAWRGGAAGSAPYAGPARGARIDLRLDANEGRLSPREAGALLRRVRAEDLRLYPDASELEGLIARRLGVGPRGVLVTAGGDEAIDRVCRVCLGPGRRLVLPSPTFEMIPLHAANTGAEVVRVPWPLGAPWPRRAVERAIGGATGLVAVVTPNNPSGAVVAPGDISAVARAAGHALVLVDLAYDEFAQRSAREEALAAPNTVVVGTLSKAWGLAGLRVGYAVGPEPIVAALRAAAGPYPVGGPALRLAAARLRGGEASVRAFVQRVRQEREELSAALKRRGAAPFPSEANFVLARVPRAERVHAGLAARGIGVRRFGSPELRGLLRITCPGEERDFARLLAALREVLPRRAGGRPPSSRRPPRRNLP